MTFEIDYVYNTKAEVRHLYEQDTRPPSSAPTFDEIPMEVLPDRIHSGDVVECHVTIRERSVVGGDAPSLVDDCTKVR